MIKKKHSTAAAKKHKSSNNTKKVESDDNKKTCCISKMCCTLDVWHIATIILGIILVVAFLTGGFGMWNNDSTEAKEEPKTDVETTGLTMYVVNDNRCDACQGQEQQLVGNLKQMFPDIVVEQVEYTTKTGKEFYDEHNLKFLPALLFTEDVAKEGNYNQISQYLQDSGDLSVLAVSGVSHDPAKELCSNGVDDNDNGDVDCADSSCSSSWECMEKKAVPEVELFIMSHCPYGTQMAKGMLPVAELLGDKIDFQLKFVNYAMHAEKEVDEQLNMYCIDKEQNAKLYPYLRCFLTDGDGVGCLDSEGIDMDKLNSCLVDTEKEFGVKSDFADKSTWKGNFASFNIHDADNVKYGVRGSPHLVVNGVEPESGRDSVSLLSAVCLAFEDKPEECNTVFEAGAPSPGFGWTETGSNNLATCG